MPSIKYIKMQNRSVLMLVFFDLSGEINENKELKMYANTLRVVLISTNESHFLRTD